ncbi:MAG: hypothetical protein ACOX0Q_03810 [Syntrophomonadaceae bacterium]
MIKGSDLIICADGGANYAHEMGLIPAYIVGDMDSIRPEVKEFFAHQPGNRQKIPAQQGFYRHSAGPLPWLRNWAQMRLFCWAPWGNGLTIP